jgi:putative SOS response-associated peptidase YedK
MCGRYVSRMNAAAEREWALSRTPPDFESYNVAPTQPVPVIRARDGERTCELLRWGLVPFWAKGIAPKYSTINARVEGIATAPSWRGPWKRGQRCILPALGFYEWQVRGTAKQPYYIHLTDRASFGLAGLWDASTAADGTMLESCTIITLPANHLLAEIHNARQRMPAILRPEDHEAWLSGEPDAALECLAPYADELMTAYPVSTRVNSPKNNEAGLLERAAGEAP